MHNSDRERLFSNLLNKDEHNSEDLAAPSSRYSNVDILLKKQSPLLSPKLKSRPASIHHPPQPNLNESDVPSRMLQAKLDSLQQENTSLRQNNDTRLLNDRINALIQENDVLVSQSKNYQMQLSTANHSNTTLSQDLKNLELMYNDAIQDLQKFESENHQLILKKEMFDRDSKQYSIEIENLNYNLNLVEGDYKKSVEEVKGLEERNLDLKKSLDVLTSRYEKCVDDGKMQFMRDRELMDAFKKVEDLQIKNNILKKEFDALSDKHDNLLKVSKSLENSLMDSKESELFMKSSLEEKIQQTNDAILAKEKSELRQEAAEKEIARLHERVQTLNLKYRENAETQINTIKAQYTAEKRRLTDEIITLETSRSKMQNTMERAIREKRSVEAQLEKLANNIPSETERISNILQDLSSRLSIAQSDSARAVSKMESIHQKYLRLQNTSDKEKQQLLDVNQESYKRLRVLESDHLQSKEEAVNLTRQLSVLDHAFKNTKEQLQKMEIQHEHDLKTISSKYEATIEDLTLKLSEKTNNCSRISSDLQKLLVEQSNMSLKWKDESKSITDHFNSLVIDLKANNTRLDSQINTLEDRVQLLTLKKQDFENQLMVEKKNCARLVVEIQNQKAAADGANQRILHFMAREAEILDEKKQIERNFDRLVLEKERLERDARKPAARANTRPVDFRDHKVDALWAEVNRVKNRTAKAQYVVDISADNSDDDV